MRSSILVIIAMAAAMIVLGSQSCSDSTGGGGKDGSLDDVCKADFDPNCGEPCISSVDCGADLHCGPDNTCRADCTPGGDECGEDALCVAHGRCMDTCAGVEVDLTMLVPLVMLLIDQSGSMSENFGGQPRWDAVETALVGGSGVVPALEDEVFFGVALYTSNGGFAGGECPIIRSATPALNNSGPIADLIGDNGPDGDTPTGESLVAVTDIIKAIPSDPLHPRGANLIVLATDGEPDTCEVPNPQNGLDDSIAGAQYAFDNGIRVVVLSVGRDVSEPHLKDMANAGAGLPLDGPDQAPFYVADDPAALLASFDEIVQGARGCVFALDGEVEPIEYASYGEVKLNDQTLPFDDPDGWRLLDSSTLELRGEACQTFLNSEEVNLDATFPCGVVATD